MALCIIIVWSLIFPAFACDNSSPLPVNTSLAGGCDVPLVGPFSGSLSHKEEYQADVNVTDFIAEVTFKNSSTAGGRWGYGVLFRHSEDTFHAIRVTSDGEWTHDVVTNGRWNNLEGGNVSGLQTGAGQYNHLHIIVIGRNGWFYVNGQFITELNTSGLTQKGDIRVATGIGIDYRIEGKTTDFEDFAIWSLDEPTSGPSRGSLKHEKDRYIEEYSAYVDVRDFIAEATFKNPSTNGEMWDYGFLFRCSGAIIGIGGFYSTFHAIRVTSDGTWTHDVVTEDDLPFGGTSKWNNLDEGNVSGLQTETRQYNHLRIIVIGHIGWFYVNGQLITELDTSGLTQKGGIRVATGIYSSYVSEGKTINFDDFTVWSLDGCSKLPVYKRDKDKDGVTDDRDDCYNPDCNIVDYKGCPKDSDKDGLKDCNDACFNPECLLIDYSGCPKDSDRDGVNDCDDRCPSGCAQVDSDGCPLDSDKDGVNDCDDECPSDCTIVDSDGCPLDSDGDGVNECDDKCPSDCTIVDSDGCPKDSDGDGVNDCNDKCPNEASPRKKDGCPGICLGTEVLVVLVIIGSIFGGMRRTGSKSGRDI